MTLSVALVAILVIAVAAGLFARNRAKRLRSGGARLNSLPNYHALYVGLWAALPALLFLAGWDPVQSGLVDQAVLASPAGQQLPDFDMARDTILAEARDIATGAQEAGIQSRIDFTCADLCRSQREIFGDRRRNCDLDCTGGGTSLLLRRLGVDFRARSGVERWMLGLLLGASLIAILTTLGIVLSLLFESLRFFNMVSPTEFLFGTTWSRKRRSAPIRPDRRAPSVRSRCSGARRSSARSSQ